MIKTIFLTLAISLPTAVAFVEHHEKKMFEHESNAAEIAVHNRIVEICELEGKIADLELELASVKKKKKSRHL